MQIAPNELLKTKEQKSAPNESMKIKELSSFRYYSMINKEIAVNFTFIFRAGGLIVVRNAD